MPLLELHTNVPRPEDDGKLTKALANLVAEAIGKPVQYVMVRASFGEAMSMAGTTDHTAFVRLSSIGKIGREENKAYSAKICKFLSENIGVDPQRVYLNFVDVPRENWGVNGDTFAK